MALKFGIARGRDGRFRLLLGTAVVFVLLMGWAAQPRSAWAASLTQDDPQQNAASAQDTAKEEKPPAKKDADKKSDEASTADEALSLPEGGIDLDDDEQRQALIEMIKAAVAAKQKEVAQTPTRETLEPVATTQPGSRAAARSRRSAATAKDKDCGPTVRGPAVDLTPPPPEKSQPKFVCKKSKVVTEVWQLEVAKFEFEIVNEGEAPLAIKLSGG